MDGNADVDLMLLEADAKIQHVRENLVVIGRLLNEVVGNELPKYPGLGVATDEVFSALAALYDCQDEMLLVAKLVSDSYDAVDESNGNVP